MTLEEAKEALNKYFSDTDRTPSETVEGLRELRDEIDVMIDAIRSDMERQDG